MLKLLILIAAAACCLAAPTIEKDHVQAIAQTPTAVSPTVLTDAKPITERIVLVSDAEAVEHHEQSIEAKKQQQSATVAVPTILLHREKRDQHGEHVVAPVVVSTTANPRDYPEPTPVKEQKAQPTQHQGIQNLRGELRTEEAPKVAAETRPKREHSVEQEQKPQATKYQGIQHLREDFHKVEEATEVAEHKEQHNAEETRPKREQSEEQHKEQQPQATQFLGIQNLRGELPKEEQEAATTPDYQPEHDAILEKRSASDSAAPQHAVATVPATLPAQLPVAAAEKPKKPVGPLVLKPVAAGRSRRDIPVPLVPKNQHGEAATNEHKASEATTTHNDDEVLVEDLSEGTPAPKPKEDDSSAATTKHTILRHHPVPVAELFNRPKQQPTNAE